MKPIVENALGHVTPELHIEEDGERLFAYFGRYGESVTSKQEPFMITDKFPRYPTKNIVEVEVEELNAAYRVVRARSLDTSNPANIYGEWHSIDEL